MAFLSVPWILQSHLQIFLVRLETCWDCNLFPRTTRSPVAVLQAPQNNDTRCHATLSTRKKIEARKEIKIPKFELFWLVSEKPGTEQTCSQSFLLMPGLVFQIWPGARVPPWVMAQGALSHCCSLRTAQLLFRIPPDKDSVCHSIIRMVYPIRSTLLVKLERMVVAAPHPCGGTSPKFWPQGNVNYHLADSFGGAVLVVTDEPSKLLPYRQSGLAPDCSSADSVIRPSSSGILFSTAQAAWRRTQPCESSLPSHPPGRWELALEWCPGWKRESFGFSGVQMEGSCTKKRIISSLVIFLRFQKEKGRSK